MRFCRALLCRVRFAHSIAGSAYTYGYATLGEIFAWIIGWDLVLEYAFGAATVASGWAGYFVSFLQDRGIHIPPELIGTYGQKFAFYHDRWTAVATLPAGVDLSGVEVRSALFNLVAFLIIALVTYVLVIGIKESANLNTGIVIVKVSIVLLFIAIAAVLHP